VLEVITAVLLFCRVVGAELQLENITVPQSKIAANKTFLFNLIILFSPEFMNFIFSCRNLLIVGRKII
jgi:hypothetical protein